jgi:hypothetical protein
MRLARIVLLCLCLLTPAGASPLTPWLDEMDRAVGQGEAAMLTLARAAPEFARIWARGHLAEPDQHATLRRLAQATHDEALLRLLDAPNLPQLQAQATASELPAWSLVVEQELVAEIAFYSALFRAAAGDASELAVAKQSERAERPASATERRGNPPDSLPFSAAEASELAVAKQSERAERPASAAERRGNPPDSLPFSAAEASELAVAKQSERAERPASAAERRGNPPDSLPFSAAEASGLPAAQRLAEGRAVLLGALDWHQDLMAWHGPPGVPAGEEPTLTAALNAWQQGRPAPALLEQARQAAERSGDRLRALLIEHLAARIDPDPGQRRTRSVQVLQAVRPLGQPAVTGAILAGLVHSTEVVMRPGRRHPEADQPFLNELLDLGPAIYLQPWARAALRTADRQLTEAAARAPLAASTRLIDVQVRLATLMADLEAQGLALTQAVHNRRQRGLDDEIAALVAAGEAIVELAPHHQSALRKAGVQARFALGEVAGVEDVVRQEMAENHWTIGQLRLAQGRFAPAFAHANAGLRRMRQRPHPEEAERRGLHDLAAAALLEAGLVVEARARAAFGTLPSEAPGHRGCLLARTGRGAEALAVLATLEDPASGSGRAVAKPGEPAKEPATERRPFSAADAGVGRTCKAAIELAEGRLEDAEATLNPLRTLLNPDPLLHWRTLALAAKLAHARGRFAEASHLARDAVQRWLALGGERPVAGGASLQTVALPESALPLLAELPDWFAAAAQAQPQEAAAHHQAAVDAVLLYRRVRAAPEALPDPPVPAEVALRLPLVRMADLRIRAANVRLEEADRVRLGTRIVRAVEDARQAHARLNLEHPERAGWLHPRAPAPLGDTAAVVYHLGPDRGHLWLLLPGEAPRHHPLPGAQAIASLLVPAWGVLVEPEKPFQIEHLRAPVPVLFPFLSEPALAAQLADRPLAVVLDRPLEGFPLEALVLAPGEPPVFLGARHTLHRGVGHGPGRTRPDRPAGVAVVGDSTLSLPSTPMSTLGEFFEGHGALVVTEPISEQATLGTGPVGALTVVCLQRPGPLGRAALHHRGVKHLIFLINPPAPLPQDPDLDDAETAGLEALIQRLAKGEPDALRALQREAMQSADPAVWHPGRWARLVVEDAP